MKEKGAFPWGGVSSRGVDVVESETGGKAWEADRVPGNEARGPVAALGGRPEEAGEPMEPMAAPGEAESRCPGWHLAQTLRLLPCFHLIALAVAAPADGLPAGGRLSAGNRPCPRGSAPRPAALQSVEVPRITGSRMVTLPGAPAGRGAPQQGVGEGAIVTSGRENSNSRVASLPSPRARSLP